MTTLWKTITRLSNSYFASPQQQVGYMLLLSLFIGFSACSSNKPSGPTKRIKLNVGEIKEVSLSDRGSSPMQLIGTSDNEEVVSVSRPELAPAVDTLNRKRPDKAVFQLKGVTAGTANVTFTEKAPNDPGPGQIRKTYIVQVNAK